MSVEKLLTITYGAAFLIAWVFLLLETRNFANNRTRSFIYYMLFALLLLIVSAAFIPKAEAAEGDWRVNVTLTTVHFIDVPENVSEFNNENTGVIVEYMVSDSEYVFGGAYKNSFYKKCEVIEQCDELSLAFGVGSILYEGEFLRIDKFRFATEAGIATGYETSEILNIEGGATVLAGFAASFEIVDNHAAKILFAVPGFVGLEYQYGFNGL
jgi:hypothetical protein